MCRSRDKDSRQCSRQCNLPNAGLGVGRGPRARGKGFAGMLVNSINYNNQRHVSSAAAAAGPERRGRGPLASLERDLANCPMLMTSLYVGACMGVCVCVGGR